MGPRMTRSVERSLHKHLFSACCVGSESAFLGSDPSWAHFSCGLEQRFDPELHYRSPSLVGFGGRA